MRERPAWRTLTAQQRYLIERIPSTYNLNIGEAPPEPPEIKRARLLIAGYEAKEANRKCKAKKRNEALVERAKQAVYFDPPEKALRIIQQVEKLVKGCPI